MLAKALPHAHKTSDEVFVQNDTVSLCMLLNRRARAMRVIDFRAGVSSAKREFVRSFARREGMYKIYTLVERDEVVTWVKLGFSKEGSIPGFYKRSDAFLLGCLASGPAPAAGSDPEGAPNQSETRLIAARPVGAGAAPTPAQERMERTIAQAKKSLKEEADRALPAAKLSTVTDVEARRAVAAALRNGRALSGFEPFGRDVRRRFFVATSRGGHEVQMSLETQACFGNAYLDLLIGPASEPEKLATTAAVGALCESLLAEEVVSCFALAPSDDPLLAFVYLHNGFRRTGLLIQHLLVAGRRKDAVVWSRKLANPSEH